MPDLNTIQSIQNRTIALAVKTITKTAECREINRITR